MFLSKIKAQRQKNVIVCKQHHYMLIGIRRYYFNALIRLFNITVLADRYGTTTLIVPFLDEGYFS